MTDDEHLPDIDSDTSTGIANRETLAIPTQLRHLVDERDAQHCRVCGKHLGNARALHHINFGAGGMGARRHHELNNLISVCWMWPGNCHDRVHGNKRLWIPVLEQLTVTPAVTGLQLLRWSRRPVS